jgi:hypothetical protein
VPFNSTSLLPSNSAENEWWAIAGIASANAMSAAGAANIFLTRRNLYQGGTAVKPGSRVS